MGDNFLSKSFLFEVVDSATERIIESFTLIFPPQSYSIKEKQRINITKTFGNAFIDDYGPDNLEITMRGISGTAHAFPTFQTKGASLAQNTFALANENNINTIAAGASQGYTAKDAFYYFRDRILRYKDMSNYDQKELRVYDLADEQAYKCTLLEFSLDRSADQPLRYPFTISLFVYARFGSKEISKAKPIAIGKNPINALDNLLSAMTSFEKKFTVFKSIQKIKNQIAVVNNQTQLLRSKFNSWLETGRNILESPLLLTKQLIDSITDLGGIIYDTYSEGRITIDTYATAKENITNQLRETLSMYGYAIQEGSQTSKNNVIEVYSGMDYDTDPSSPKPTAMKKSFSYSGLNLYTVHEGDSLQSLAQKYLGDENLWPNIAAANATVQSNSDLIVGSTIYIPVASDAVTESKDSYIATEDTLRNPYGSDISLDADGSMILQESNDVSLINGINNVLQSIDVRLKTVVGSMIKQSAFGLMSAVGMPGTDAARSYLRMNFRNSLMQDPRIIEVTNIGLGFFKDSIRISADIKLVGMDTSIPITTSI